MDLSFSNNRIRKLCASRSALQRALGQAGARKAIAHLASLQAAATLEDVRHLPGHCHELAGDRAGQLALHLPDGRRLIFEPAAQPPPEKPDGGLDWTAVRAIHILEIADYH